MTMQLSEIELEAMLDRAAKKGAEAALTSLGLNDDAASRDILEMRSLMDAWRETKKSVWSTTVKIATAALLTFIAAAVWWNIKGA